MPEAEREREWVLSFQNYPGVRAVGPRIAEDEDGVRVVPKARLEAALAAAGERERELQAKVDSLAARVGCPDEARRWTAWDCPHNTTIATSVTCPKCLYPTSNEREAFGDRLGPRKIEVVEVLPGGCPDEGQREADECICGHTRHWHGAGEWRCEARGPEHPDGECGCAMFEDKHDPRCPGDCGPCGGIGGIEANICLYCGGDGECVGCSTAYRYRVLRREYDVLRGAVAASPDEAESDPAYLATRAKLDQITREPAVAASLPADEPKGDAAYENGRGARVANRSLQENPETSEAKYARWATGWLDEHHGKPRIVVAGPADEGLRDEAAAEAIFAVTMARRRWEVDWLDNVPGHTEADRNQYRELARAALAAVVGCPPEDEKGRGIFDEALTEEQTRLRLQLARAMAEAERSRGRDRPRLTDEEVLDAYWDELDAIWPILQSVAGRGRGA